MGNHPTTRNREFRQGWIGRRRNYTCRECAIKFQVDTLGSWPEIDRVCPECRRRTRVYTFVNPKNGREVQVRASDAELATLRAWRINPNLTFKEQNEESNNKSG